MNILSSFKPQGLCICCCFLLSFLHGWVLLIYQLSAQVSPPDLSWDPHLFSVTALCYFFTKPVIMFNYFIYWFASGLFLTPPLECEHQEGRGASCPWSIPSTGHVRIRSVNMCHVNE